MSVRMSVRHWMHVKPLHVDMTCENYYMCGSATNKVRNLVRANIYIVGTEGSTSAGVRKGCAKVSTLVLVSNGKNDLIDSVDQNASRTDFPHMPIARL
jgi:hypothetical protein